MTQKRLLHILYLFVLVLLFLPFFQEQTSWFSLKKLGGYLPQAVKPSWSSKRWIKEEFQQEAQTFINNNVGFRSLFIRIYNQLDFSLFKIPHLNGVVIGKKNYLFESSYIKDYTGAAFIGEETIDERLARIWVVQEMLKKKNIDLVVIFSPGKASFYPEYIPESFHPEKTALSNYKYFSKRSNEIGINNIDFNRYFLLMKDTVTWPIYPKCGIHWSVYGMGFCVDSLFRYIEKSRGILMPDFGWNGVEVPDTLRDTDNDMGEAMNLLFNIKTPKGAYPRLYFKDRPGMAKPDVLVIADSFYWTIFGNAISYRMFNKNSFWYYFEQAYSNTISGVDVKTLDVKKEIESHQVVILMSTEANLFKFPFGFLERVYPLFFPSDTAEQHQLFRKLIVWDKGWLNEVRERAASNNTSLEKAVEEEVKITLFYKDSLQPTEKDYAGIINGIRSDAAWMEKEKQKAKERGLTLDQVLRDDAKWIFTTQQKHYRRKYWPGFQ